MSGEFFRTACDEDPVCEGALSTGLALHFPAEPRVLTVNRDGVDEKITSQIDDLEVLGCVQRYGRKECEKNQGEGCSHEGVCLKEDYASGL